MKLKSSDDILLKINKLKNLRSIVFRDLSMQSVNDKHLIIPGFMISTESNDFMYLTNQDAFFEDFVKKIRELYLAEKDNVYDDGVFGERKLDIDPLTRNILINGTVENVSALYGFYKGKDSYDESLLFEEDKLNAFRGIVIYHLKETMKFFDVIIQNVKLSEGMNGVYYLRAELNNKSVILPLYFNKASDNIFEVVIGNLFENSIPFNMEIIFGPDKISVSNTIHEYDLSDYTTYEFKESGIVEKEVLIGNNLRHYKKEHLDTIVNVPSNLAMLDNKELIQKWYRLPWNAYEGVTIIDNSVYEDDTLDNSNRFVTERRLYLAEESNNFYIRDTYLKRYRKNQQDFSKVVELVFDHVEKQLVGIRRKNGYMIETKFLGKYFYHISNVQTKKDLMDNVLYSIGKAEGLDEKIDSLDIKKYIK